MARNKETLVLLLDVGPTMHQHLPYAAKALSALVQRKLVHSKFDEVGVVYFGADETDNELSEELEGYENIVVARPVSVVSSDLASAVENPSKGSGVADFMSALVVGMDMIVRKMGVTSKGNKRICLITDAETAVREPAEGGSKEGEAVNLAEQMQQQAVGMDAVVIRLTEVEDALQSNASRENEILLKQIASRTKGGLVLAESYASLLGAVRTRLVSPTSLFRGDLELTPTMSVKIRVYKKVSTERFPSMKIFSDKAPRTDSHATHEVVLDTEYKSVADDLDKSIPPEQRVKAYKYGPQFVPISSRDEEALKFKTEKGLKLIGFTDATNVPRHYSMKEANVFVPEPGNARAELAISCLARAMATAQMVAIVRCVWRVGQTNVVLGVLTPYLSTEDDVADCFYFNILPFAEDVREYQFASFKDRPAGHLPTTAQQDAVDSLVQKLDLASDALEEQLQPERTVNPVLQRFYSFLHMKAVNPEADVPPLDAALRHIVEPEQKFLHANELQSFQEQFTLSHITEKKGRAYWQEGLERAEAQLGLPEQGEDLRQEDDGKPLALEFLINKKVDDVGSVNPVQDFDAMLARRDSPEWVSRAISGMKKVISDLLSSAYNGNTFEKAMSCLVALRAGCVIQEEPADFNSFLQETAKQCQSKRLRDFWALMVSKSLTLISKDEAPDSEVSQDEAASFLRGQTSPGKGADGAPDDEVDEMEALLDDVI